MGLTMAQHRQAPSQFKEEPSNAHHPHHHQQQQGSAHPHLQHQRPSSVVHQQHHQQAHPPPQQQQQQHSAYQSGHAVYQQQQQQQQPQAANAQHAQDLPYYAHPSPYSTPGATSGYTSADTSDMMAATMPRPPYPPMSYHTPQSASPASVASPSGHDQQRSIYGQPTSQLHQQSMYYGAPPQQYPSMQQQAAPSPYGQHPQQPHQSMTSQPNMMMSHQAPQHPMTQHANHHAQAGMTGSPRHPIAKIEAHMTPTLQRSAAPGPLGPSPTSQNGASLNTPTGSTPGVNPNAAPGPIPATTPLVVRQDQNGVQWIAFEYSRDRVKMEYTIRCDVESVDTEKLTNEFKTENCVYPRACCSKEQYRGNRLQYETECNTVGWALAQLNAPLRGKRGLIQRAVDSWRNSNQDPRLRSRRVRRMAKINTRKVQPPTHPGQMAGGAPGGMPPQGGMGGAPSGVGKPGMTNNYGQHHEGSAHGGGDDVGEDYMDESQHHQSANSDDHHAPSQVFQGYGQYPGSTPASHSTSSYPDPQHHHLGAARRTASGGPSAGRSGRDDTDESTPDDLFPDLPDTKKRKFILVDDSDRQSRLRVRVTLSGVDTREIPDSFRKGASVYPRSYFAREMQSPPPSATGSKFFPDDEEDDGNVETEAGSGRTHRGKMATMVKVPLADGQEADLAIPRMRKAMRSKEVRLNDLGYRMAWLQSRVFAGRTVFLQRALDCYRNKTRTAVIDSVLHVAPHYETRAGKRRWGERTRSRGAAMEKKEDGRAGSSTS